MMVITVESTEEDIAKYDGSNLSEKLRTKQPGESIEEKDLKAAIKENNFNQNVESKIEEKVCKELIRKGVHKNDVKAEAKSIQAFLTTEECQ